MKIIHSVLFCLPRPLCFTGIFYDNILPMCPSNCFPTNQLYFIYILIYLVLSALFVFCGAFYSHTHLTLYTNIFYSTLVWITLHVRANHLVELQVLYLTVCTAIVGCWPDDNWKPKLVQRVLIHCFGVLSSALSPVATYHNEQNKPKAGICVANHTSPIDALVLMCDNCYSLVSGELKEKGIS